MTLKDILCVGVFLALCSTTLQTWQWHKHHDSSQQEEQAVVPLTQEDIDTGLQDENDPLTKYKFTVIAFDQALRMKLGENLLHSITQICKKSHFENNFIVDFPQFVNCVTELVDGYAKKFLNNQYYPKIAYFYRLLLWIKYRMRYHDEVLNVHFEIEINEILEFFGETDLNILQDIMPGRYFFEKCLHINSIERLKNLGYVQDRIMDFCIKLTSDGAAAKDTANVTMPFHDDVQLYENFLLEIANVDSYFKHYLGKSRIDILIYIYEAFLRRSDHIVYQRIKGEDIILNEEDSSQSPMRYFRDIITLYGQALEKSPLLQIHNTNILENILRLENFPSDERHGEKNEIACMRFEAICTLVTYIVNDYEEEIKSREEQETFTPISKTCYCRILYWTRIQLTKAAVLPMVEHALRNILSARKSDCGWQGKPDHNFINKTKLSDVLDICTSESVVQVI